MSSYDPPFPMIAQIFVIAQISVQEHSDCVKRKYTWSSECEIAFPGGSACHTAPVSSEHTRSRAYQHDVSSILFSVFANLIGKIDFQA